MKRFGKETGLSKQVYHVQNVKTGLQYVGKVFMPYEMESYYQEVALNNLIDKNTTRQVLMATNFDPNQIQAPLIIKENTYPVYAYILLPYYKNGTLLDLIMKSNSKNIKLSTGLKNYLWLQCLLCVYDLLCRSELSHLDLKPDNFIFDDDCRLMLIDFGHTTAYYRPT